MHDQGASYFAALGYSISAMDPVDPGPCPGKDYYLSCFVQLVRSVQELELTNGP